MKDYLRKNVSFDKLSKEEMELYEALQKLPHGEFNKRTKEFWKKRMKEVVKDK